MKEQRDLMLYISVLEDSISPQMKAFENTVRNRWRSLPNLEANTIYHMCPYFGSFLDDIEKFFETGIMRIAHDISRKFNAFAEKNVELSWFGVNSNYSELLDGYCTPFVEAFEAASSGGLNRLNQARKELERSASDSRYGYITNSFTYMLAVETVSAIASAMRSVENDNRAWQVATAPQQSMHNRLVRLWGEKFEPVFMKQVEAENVAVTKEIIEHLCLASKFTYELYIEAKEQEDFETDKKQFLAKQNEAKESIALKKKEKREKLIATLREELARVEEQFNGIGFALWGEKRREKKALEQRKEQLLAEIQATTSCPRLPSTYVFAFSHSSAVYKKFVTTPDNSDFFKKNWKFVYDSAEKGYTAYMPDGNSLFVLKGTFLQSYGHGRTFGGRFETFLDEWANATVTQVRFALFEIDE